MLLEASAVTKQFGGFRAVSEASISVAEGEIVGLIGPNGAGKSTMFNCLSGDLPPTSGRIVYDGHDVTRASPEVHARLGIGRTFQVPVTFEDMTIIENVMVGAFLHHASRHAAYAAALEILDRTGLASIRDRPARSLGTPGRKRLEIARALATRPRLMLLDEALAGLNANEIASAIELVRAIHASGVTLIVVEHVMEVIMSLAKRILVFNEGRVIASGAPGDVVQEPEVIRAYLGQTQWIAAAPGAAPP